MNKFNKYICIPFTVICILSVLYICYLSCMPTIFENEISAIIAVVAFIIVIFGIFIDTTYFIREKIVRGLKNEEITK